MAKTKKSRRKQQRANKHKTNLFIFFLAKCISISCSHSCFSFIAGRNALQPSICYKKRIHTRDSRDCRCKRRQTLKRSQRATRGSEMILRNSGNLLPLKRNHCTECMHCTALHYIIFRSILCTAHLMIIFVCWLKDHSVIFSLIYIG